jgi:hypothetical protein
MDVQKILSDLRAQRDRIEDAIKAFERIAAGNGRRPGRPPAWMSALKEDSPKRRGRPPGSKSKPKEE